MKRRKPLARRSAKTVARDAELAVARSEREAMCRGWCEAPARFCTAVDHRGVHAHHVKRRSQGGGHTVDNLRWLCFTAHRYVHDHPAEAAAAGLLAMRVHDG